MYEEEQLPTKYYVTKCSKFLVINIMIDISMTLLEGSTSEQELFLKINNKAMNHKSQSLKKVIKFKVYSPYQDNIWGGDLVNVTLISQ